MNLQQLRNRTVSKLCIVLAGVQTDADTHHRLSEAELKEIQELTAKIDAIVYKQK